MRQRSESACVHTFPQHRRMGRREKATGHGKGAIGTDHADIFIELLPDALHRLWHVRRAHGRLHGSQLPERSADTCRGSAVGDVKRHGGDGLVASRAWTARPSAVRRLSGLGVADG